jgi:hypothetical protein
MYDAGNYARFANRDASLARSLRHGEQRMHVNDRMWVLDKSETFALSAWLAQAVNVRREINRLLFSEWEEVKSARALSFSILRRYIGYWNAHRDLTEREAMGTHGGNYAEEIVASIIRGLIQHRFGDSETNLMSSKIIGSPT